MKVENLPKETDYIIAMEVFVAFGRVERIKKKYDRLVIKQIHIDNAESAALAQSKTNNMEVLRYKLI